MLYVSDVKSTQTLLTPEGAQILLPFLRAPFSVSKFLQKFDGKWTFRAIHQNKSHIGKNYAYFEEASLVLLFHFRWIFVDIFGRVKSYQKQWVINCFFIDSVMKFMFLLNTLETDIFHIFLIDGPQASTNWFYMMYDNVR